MSLTKKEEVISSLEWAVKRFGKPKRILCDNGPQFKSDELKEWCRANGITRDPCPPYYPECKGKVERTIRNFKEEFLVLDKVFENAADLLPEYNEWFNNERIALGVGGPPASFYL